MISQNSLGCKDIGIGKSEFVARTLFFCEKNKIKHFDLERKKRKNDQKSDKKRPKTIQRTIQKTTQKTTQLTIQKRLKNDPTKGTSLHVKRSKQIRTVQQLLNQG